jgi:4-amino-4-deoxy-L-arabinose transferase-like glycosyltransferase
LLVTRRVFDNIAVTDVPATAATPRRRSVYAGLALVLAFGIFLRLPSANFSQGGALHALDPLHPQPLHSQSSIGFDEALYRDYVNTVATYGLTAYPEIVERYIERQRTLNRALLPPTRFLYIFCAYAWHTVFGSEALDALRNVASVFGILTLLVATAFAWRIRGPAFAISVAALMSVGPTLIHMSQHALIDGVSGFWALLSLWLLWENLNAPRNWRWLLAYALSLSCMVLTKENAFFAYVGLLALIAANRWLRFGVVTRELLLATVAGPLLGVVVLIFLCGGVGNFITTYRDLVSQASHLQYAIMTGDGPWHRYLVDLLLVSPIVLLLALAKVFRLDRQQKPELFLALFVAASYALMCNVRYGMNLRYANMWEMPLRTLAVAQLETLFAFHRRRSLWIGIAVVVICASDLRQYITMFVQYPLYELVTAQLMEALRILKFR